MSIDSELDTKRIQGLTDAAFAVAMTILILDVKIPDGLSSSELSTHFLLYAVPDLLIYFIGFVTLGIFWIGSHFHHHHLLRTDRICSWINILFLMMICIIPFSISFIRNYRHETLSIIVYSVNLIAASGANYLMLWYAWKKRYVKPYFTPKDFKHAKHRILIPIYFYLGIILISFFATNIALFLFFGPVVLHILPEKGNRAIDH